MVVTSATSHWAWVQIEVKALKSPLVGWVITACWLRSLFTKILPPPTGMSEVLAVIAGAAAAARRRRSAGRRLIGAVVGARAQPGQRGGRQTGVHDHRAPGDRQRVGGSDVGVHRGLLVVVGSRQKIRHRP